MLIDYIVEKGYDDEDYKNDLGINKGSKLIHFLLSNSPNYDNSNFLVHVESFITDYLKVFNIKQLQRLLEAVKLQDRFKDSELLANLQEQFNKVLSRQEKKQGFKNEVTELMDDTYDSDEDEEAHDEFEVRDDDEEEDDEFDVNKLFNKK